MLRTLAASLLALVVTVTAAGGQEGPDVRLERVRTTADSMQIYMVRGTDTLHVGTLWDSLQVTQHAGGPAVRRVYRTENRAFGPEHSTYVYRLPGLTPLAGTEQGSSPQSLEFRADSVVGWITPPRGRRRTVARALGPHVYDASVFDLLVRAGDLREGYSVSVRAYVSSLDSVTTLTARVTGTERVTVEGGRMADTWVVEMDFAGLSTTLWIDRQTRALQRQVIRLAPGISMLMNRTPVIDPGTRQS